MYVLCVTYIMVVRIISLPLTVFTATISQSVLLRVDLISRALYTMPNSPEMNSKLLHLNNIAMQYILGSFGKLEMTKYIQAS